MLSVRVALNPLRGQVLTLRVTVDDGLRPYATLRFVPRRRLPQMNRLQRIALGQYPADDPGVRVAQGM